mgnify:CR=1 FL=1
MFNFLTIKKGNKNSMNLFEKILLASIMAFFTTALIIGSALLIFIILI